MKSDFNNLNKSIIKENLKGDLSEKFSFEIYKEVNSTNNKAKKFAKNNCFKNKSSKDKDIIVFAADKQSAGRGRRGHSWLSNDPAGLFVSFLFKAQENLDKMPQITAAAALAVKDNFEYFDLETRIKWPNDILVDQKKICGILSELVFDKEKSEAYIIIGCGINLNNDLFNSSITEIATSYYLEKNRKINKNIFLAQLSKNINKYIKAYFSDDREKIIKCWKEILNLKGKKIDLKYKNKNYTVLIKKILDSGELFVEFENGEKKALQSINTSLNYSSIDKYND